MSKGAANVGIKEAYRKWHETKGGSLDHFLGIADPEIHFGSVPRGAAPLTFAKQYDNRKAMKAYFDGLLADWTMVHYTVDEYIAQADSEVARGSCAWTNKTTGKFAETPKVDFWRPRRQGFEFYEYFDTACVAAGAA